MAHAVEERSSYHTCMTRSEIASFIQRLMRRELGDGELSALTTRDLDDINTYLAERAKTSRAAQQDIQHRAEHTSEHSNYGARDYSARARIDQQVKAVQGGLQAFKSARTYSEREILLELGVLDQAE